MNYRRISKRKILLLFGDLVIIFVSLNFAYAVRLGMGFDIGEFNKNIFLWIFLSVIYVFSFYVFDLYNIRMSIFRSRSFFLFSGSLSLVFLVVMGCFYIFPFHIGRGIFILSFGFTAVMVFIWRSVYSSLSNLAFEKRRVLLIGSGYEEQMIQSLIKNNPDYEITGVISDDLPKNNPGFAHLGTLVDMEDVVHKYKVDDIVTILEPTSKDELIHGLVGCKMEGISIYDLPTFYENLMGKLPVLHMKEKWFFYSTGFDRLGDKLYKRVKRIIDILVSFSVLVVSIPFSFLIVLFIKLDSKGPVFYIQRRLGEKQKSYRLIKFRTMVENAEKQEPQWASENDDRITRVGKILRKTRLDELPQLINILKGEMSIIGPRPEREYFVKKLEKEVPFYSLRFSVKPGLSGWAQVNYRYGASVEDAVEKLMYDLYYIKNMSLYLDSRILLRTIRISLFGMGR